MEKVSLSAGAVESANVIVAKMVAGFFPVYLGRALVNVCETARGQTARHNTGTIYFSRRGQNVHKQAGLFLNDRLVNLS